MIGNCIVLPHFLHLLKLKISCNPCCIQCIILQQIYPNEVLLSSGEFELVNESIVLCHQIRTIDKKRLSKTYGKIENNKVKENIIEALCFQLGIETNYI